MIGDRVKTIQCVPNFSEGRSEAVIESIVSVADCASDARIIDYSADPDHNRMVVTLLGCPDEIRASVLAAAREAVKSIDLRVHSGAHPRIGALDVVPLVPIKGIGMEECVMLSHAIGKDIADNLSIPVCFYERSATLSHRTNLADIRKGGYERLVSIGMEGDRAPDLGPCRCHETAGVTVVGARGPLVAYNVNLRTEDISAARSIVKSIRSGDLTLKGVKSMSVWLQSRSMVQVSMNLTQPELTPLRDVYAFVLAEAGRLGIEVAGSEIIGAVSVRYLEGTSLQELNLMDFKDSQILENWL